MPDPVGADIVIVPVAVVQVGCVILATGADGADGSVNVAVEVLLPAGQSVLLTFILV